MQNRNYLFGALLVLAAIVYVSLYPFRLRAGLAPGGAIHGLLAKAGLWLWRATVAVAALLLFCALVEMYLPGRSAGISDALLALLIGTLLRLTEAPHRTQALDHDRVGRNRQSIPSHP